MNNTELYNYLDSKNSEDNRRKQLIMYLKSLSLEVFDPSKKLQIAYDIAGLLSTSYAQTLSDNDDLLAILLLAGELEVPNMKKEDYDVLWKDFADSISRL